MVVDVIPTMITFHCRAMVLILPQALFVACMLREGNVEATWTSKCTLIYRDCSYFAHGRTKPQQNGGVTKVTFKWAIVIRSQVGAREVGQYGGYVVTARRLASST
jgi:hypothetical protein